MKTFKVVLVVIVLLAVIIGSYFLFGNYSEGYRAGTVIKLSKKGVAFKTYEGELNLGMVLNDQHNQMPMSTSNIWYFTVPSSNHNAVKQLEDAMLTGKRVKLHYNEKFLHMSWRGDTNYMVDSVSLSE